MLLSRSPSRLAHCACDVTVALLVAGTACSGPAAKGEETLGPGNRLALSSGDVPGLRVKRTSSYNWPLGYAPAHSARSIPGVTQEVETPALGSGALTVAVAGSRDEALRAAAVIRNAASPAKRIGWFGDPLACPGDLCWTWDAATVQVVAGRLVLTLGFESVPSEEGPSAEQKDTLRAVAAHVLEEWKVLEAQASAAPAPANPAAELPQPFVQVAVLTADLPGYRLEPTAAEPWLGPKSRLPVQPQDQGCQYFFLSQADPRYWYACYSLSASAADATAALHAFLSANTNLRPLESPEVRGWFSNLRGRVVSKDTDLLASVECPGDDCASISQPPWSILVVRRGALVISLTGFYSSAGLPNMWGIMAQCDADAFRLAQKIVARYDAWAATQASPPAAPH